MLSHHHTALRSDVSSQAVKPLSELFIGLLEVDVLLQQVAKGSDAVNGCGHGKHR